MVKQNITKKRVCTKEWKETNEEYLNALEKFLDIVDNVENERLKLDIIYQMLKCDEILTKFVDKHIIN